MTDVLTGTIEDTARLCEQVLAEVEQVIVGKPETVTMVLLGVLASGHILIEDLPGLGKTLLARTFATVLGLEFTRVQFTPDMLPADLTGTTVLDLRTGEPAFRPGPVFTGLLLADEINRTPPKTQAALLEAMAEGQVSTDGVTRLLPQPFVVLATDNPIEYEGTYPLPEAQLDRFMFNTFVDYPSEEDEFQIVRRTTADISTEVTPTLSSEDILELSHIVRRVPVADHVLRYALQFTRLTRRDRGEVPDFIQNYVSWGAGPRASRRRTISASPSASR